jgi:opacity protein-like surface antigen
MILRILTLCAFTFAIQSLKAQFRLDLEGGLVPGTNYNDVRIPAVGGTLVDVSDQLTAKPKVFYRVRAGYTIAKRHTISLLYAPLTVRYDGAFDQSVRFNNSNYPVGEDVRVDYQFNSYRLTYRYDFISNSRWTVGAGLTGKIRDADIRFRNSASDDHYSNVGFVPLVNFYVGYKPSERWTAILEGDALASKFGRAEDIFAGVSYQLNPNVGVKAGYRVVEGGADNDKIYNFTWINYASVGVLLTF